jgi:hypothetical protein
VGQHWQQKGKEHSNKGTALADQEVGQFLLQHGGRSLVEEVDFIVPLFLAGGGSVVLTKYCLRLLVLSSTNASASGVGPEGPFLVP